MLMTESQVVLRRNGTMSTKNTGVSRFGVFLAMVSLAGAVLTGCTATKQPQANTAELPASPSANTAGPAPSPATAVDTSQITVPVLAAMLSDEEFVKAAKGEQNLSDADVQKLRDAVQSSGASLDENTPESGRSTRAAAKSATQVVEQVLGKDRAQSFLAFVQQRWSGNTSTTASSQPNSVPTDTRIVVNAPAYRMDVFKEGELVKSYKIGIGYPEFPLPVGMRQASEIIVNPVWTPPDEPWVKGKFAPYQKVEAGSKDNPLGVLKIPIGLPSLIHGGKNPAKLGGFASHGCVGLTNPLVEDFAVQLAQISNTEMSLDDLKGFEKERDKTKDVKLGKTIPVEIRYDTIVVEDGTLYIYRDVYERGTNTEENLRRVLQLYGVPLDTLPQKDQLLSALKQMAVDATGQPADPSTSASANSKVAKEINKDKNVKITYNIKGSKVASFQIPELAGKGYPAPVGMNDSPTSGDQAPKRSGSKSGRT